MEPGVAPYKGKPAMIKGFQGLTITRATKFRSNIKAQPKVFTYRKHN